MRIVNHTCNCKPMGSVCECRTRHRSTKLMPIRVMMLQQMVAAAILFQALPTNGFTSKLLHPFYRYRTRDRPSPPSASSCISLVARTQTSLSSASSRSGGGSSKGQISQSLPDSDLATEQSRPLDVNIVLIDNYDSYTYNLYQYLACICVNPPIVVANDAYGSWDELLEAESAAGRRIDAVVISPGPGTPTCEKDIGICQEVVRNNPHLPILGVCLGHQLLGHHYGANVTLSPCGPVHGMISPVQYSFNDTAEKEVDGDTSDGNIRNRQWNLFNGIEQGFGVVRYHSLAVQFPSEESDLEALEIEPMAWCGAVPPLATAKNDDGINLNHAEQNEESPTKVCMALRHKVNPHYGVQFHPESIGTGRAGYQILYNFCEHVEVSRLTHEPDDLESDPSITQAVRSSPKVEEELTGVTEFENESTRSMHTVHIHKLPPIGGSSNPRPEVVFEKLYGSSPSAFWLDSSTGEVADIDGILVDPTAEKSKCPIRSNSRFSIMGDDKGPLSKRVEYYGEDHNASEKGTRIFSHRSDEPSACDVYHDRDNILDYLRKSIDDRGVCLSTRLVHFDDVGGESYTFEDVDEFLADASDDHVASSSKLPFEYRGGYVGYLGYEVRHDSRKFLCEQEICRVDIGACQSQSQPSPQAKSDRNVPTAAFLFADRSLVYDHSTSNWYLVGVSSNKIHAAGSGGVVSTVEWMRQTSAKLRSLPNTHVADSYSITDKKPELSFHSLDRSKAQYQEDIRRCHEEIKNGESYELCLTNQIRSTVVAKGGDGPFGLYKILRRRNPAPFSAFLRLDRLSIEEDDVASPSISSRSASVSICCSSPERFLSVSKLVLSEDSANSDDDFSHGWEFAPRRSTGGSSNDFGYKYQVESKPIKGTSARVFSQDSGGSESDLNEEDAKVAEELRLDVKNRAENLMIVDLLRNDLSRVCEVGSVHVPRLMHIESFTTVHQLVSTIRGVINSMEANAVDVISACFPGGSMTGAPKLRSVGILNEMEQGVSRGPYSGSLGYISLNGCMDMNIIIRTAVVTPATSAGEDPKEKNDKWDVSIGCGGAITALSDSEDEYNEMLLKARAVKEAVEYWADGTDSHGRDL